MQRKYLNTDGSFRSLDEYTGSTDPQEMIDEALRNSSDAPGYFVIIGDDLDKEATKQEARVVAAPGGILVFQNVLNS